MAKRIQRSVSRPQAKRQSAEARPTRADKPTGKRVASSAVTEFTIQLSTLSSAGIPIVRALKILHNQSPKGPFKEVLGELVEDVAAGTPMSEAMAKHGRCFNDLYAAMVRAGEAGGVLDIILERLAILREKIADLRAKVIGALIYPSVVVAVAFTVVAIVIVWVIPKFKEIFDSFDVELPQTTLILLNTSDVAVKYWYLVFGLPVVLFFLHVVMMRGQGYRYFVHKLLLKVPVLGGSSRARSCPTSAAPSAP